MAGPATILREIHRLRSHVQDLQSRINFAPKQLKAQQNAVAKQEDQVHQAQDKIKKLKVHIHEHEVSVKSCHQQIKKYEQQLNDITSKKEYDALKHEIANVQEHIRKEEDEALEMMSQLDAATAGLPALEATVKKAKADYAEFERDYQSRLDSWVQQRDAITKEIAAAEATLPVDIKVQYERLIKAMGADAFAAVENRICMACYTELTTQLGHNVTLQQVVMCRSCGRILYTKEG